MQTMTGDPLAQLAPKTIAQNAQPPKRGTDPFGPHAIIQPKYDGWRILAHVGEDSVQLFSRSGNAYGGKLPLVEGELLAAFPPGTWIDGEAVSLAMDGGNVMHNWGIAQSVLSSGGLHPQHARVTFVAFDLLAHPQMSAVLAAHTDTAERDGDIRHMPLNLRLAALDAAIRAADMRYVHAAPTMAATAESHDANLAQGFEGSIVKRLASPYASGVRNATWIKLKPATSIDAVIIGYEDGNNGFSGMVGALVFGQHDANGTMVERGRCSGMTLAVRQAISDDRAGYLGAVIEVAHMGVSVGQTDTGRFRHPQYKRLRLDRDAASVTLHDA